MAWSRFLAISRFSIRTLLLSTAGAALICTLFGIRPIDEFTFWAGLVLATAIPVASFGYDLRRTFRGTSVGFAVGVATATGFFFLVMRFSSVLVAGGYPSLPCTFRVIDEDTQRPVPRAIVRIRDITGYGDFESGDPDGVPVEPIPDGEPGVVGTTNNAGVATLKHGFQFSSKDGLFIHTAGVSISPDLWIQVTAPGYRQASLRLTSRLGRSRDWEKLPFPQIEIALSRPSSNTE